MPNQFLRVACNVYGPDIAPLPIIIYLRISFSARSDMAVRWCKKSSRNAFILPPTRRPAISAAIAIQNHYIVRQNINYNVLLFQCVEFIRASFPPHTSPSVYVAEGGTALTPHANANDGNAFIDTQFCHRRLRTNFIIIIL